MVKRGALTASIVVAQAAGGFESTVQAAKTNVAFAEVTPIDYSAKANPGHRHHCR